MASAWSQPRYRIATVIVVVVCTAYVYFVRRHHPSLNPRENGFTPETTLKLTLDTGAAKYTYLRVDPYHPWEPSVDAKLIERPLKVLATVSAGKLQAPAAGVAFTVGFAGTHVWSGIYGDGRFVWQDGDMEGLGFEVKGDDKDVLEEASFAFVPHVWGFCQTKPAKLEFTQPDLGILLEKTKKGWSAVKNGKPAKVAAKDIDGWLMQSCRVPVDVFKDLERYPLPPTLVPEGTFIVTADDGTKLQAVKQAGFWKLDDHTAFKSGMLGRQLEKLAELVK